MDIIFLLLTILGIIIAIIFGYLEIIVPFVKREVRLSKRFPFVESAEAAPVVKGRKKRRKKKRKQRFLVPIFAVGVVVLVIVLIRALVLQTTPLPPRPIAVMTFENLTGEKNLDYLCKAIPNLLITNLEQSKHLSVMTWERMHDLLKALDKEEVELINEELAFELCRMDAIETIVLGSFTKAGEIVVTDVKVLDVASKKLLKTTSARGEGVASILKTQIDELSKEISRGVGLSEREVEATKLQITEATTSSMDAYNYFLRGREDWDKYYYADARKFLEKAVELDSTFAVAYVYLAWTYSELMNFTARREAFEKAKAFSKTATKKEQLYIEAFYANVVEKDPEKRFHILKKMAIRYPKEKRVYLYLGDFYGNKKQFSKAIEEYNKALVLDPNYGPVLNNLAYVYVDIEEYDAAIEYFERYASVSPGDANPFDSMAEMYFRMGKLDEAIAKYIEVLEVKPDFGADWKIAYIYALKEDYTETMKWIDQCIANAPSPGVKALGYSWRGFYYYWLGSLDKAFRDLHSAADEWKEVEFEFGRTSVDWMKGWIYCNKGKLELSRRHFKNWDDFIIGYEPLFIPYRTACSNFHLGFVDLKDGRIDSAKKRLAEMKSLLPEIDQINEDWVLFYYDLLHGQVLLAEGYLEKAIAVCENFSPLPTPQMVPYLIADYNQPFIRDMLARAYHQKGDLAKAILEYERLITFDPNSRDRRLIHPTYHYKLAILYEEKDLKIKAIAEYGKFLELWKDADKDSPELIDAKKRLAKLKAVS